MHNGLIAWFCASLVGLVFLLTGIAKVIEPWKFLEHIFKLKLLPDGWVLKATMTFIAIECGLGVALLLGFMPYITIPGSILLILGLSVLTYWSTKTGRTEDCGCYNDIIDISPTTSLILNGIYILLLIAAVLLNPETSPALLWQGMLVLFTILTSYALANGSLFYRGSTGYPFIDLTPIQKGRLWQKSWMEEDINEAINWESAIIVFLGPKCPHCKNWLNVLKVIHHRQDLPDVLGIISLSTTTVEQGQEFVDGYDLNFPIGGLSGEKFNKLGIAGVPTAVLLKNSMIQDKWVGKMPKEFVDTIRAGNLKYPMSQ